MIDEIFPLILISAVLLSSLVTGLVFGFAIVTRPGLAKLSNKNFLNAFKNIDEVIQKNQPIFMLVWIGSIMAVILTLTLGILLLSGMEKILLLSASLLYLLGVQLPTVFYNIPLNNMIQELDINLMEDSELEKSRSGFEKSWNRWNNIRTLNGIVAVFIWLVLLIRL